MTMTGKSSVEYYTSMSLKAKELAALYLLLKSSKKLFADKLYIALIEEKLWKYALLEDKKCPKRAFQKDECGKFNAKPHLRIESLRFSRQTMGAFIVKIYN